MPILYFIIERLLSGLFFSPFFFMPYNYSILYAYIYIYGIFRMEGGIPPLVELVEFNVTELQKAVASGLATLAYDNHDNKKQVADFLQ